MRGSKHTCVSYQSDDRLPVAVKRQPLLLGNIGPSSANVHIYL